MKSKLFRVTEGWCLERSGSYVLVATGAVESLFLGALSPDEFAAVSGAPWKRPIKVEPRPPVLRQEVWAAGVTYRKSREARLEESQGQSIYNQVYAAARPQIFFKAFPEKVVGCGDGVGIRVDSKWTVPEPELAVVFSSTGNIVGYTLGNDVSARDIEGDNVLYQPQAKVYSRSCALGPCIVLATSSVDPMSWHIALIIERYNTILYDDQIAISNLHRGLDELGAALFKCQDYPHGAILLTGTGLIPPSDYAMQPGDRITVSCAEIGTLTNSAVTVG